MGLTSGLALRFAANFSQFGTAGTRGTAMFRRNGAVGSGAPTFIQLGPTPSRVAAGAVLVCDHAAAAHGAVDPTSQYDRVQSSAGSAPIFMMQMAGTTKAHLGAADYGFFPS